MTLRGLAKEFNMPYSTARKYLFMLKERGLVRVERGPNGFLIDGESVEVFKRFLELIETGHTPKSALNFMEKNDQGGLILRMLAQILDLQKQMLDLQMEILKEMRKEKEGRLKRLFRFLFRLK